MRDSNMSVDEVKEQIEYVALVTKQASQVSDLRGHTFSNPAVMAPVVYFRGMVPGVCTYFDDRKGPSVQYPHGACWYERCHDLRVIDVPGDHFSLLRQDLEDMNILVTGLKVVLGPFGWSETMRREDKPQYSVSADEIRDIDSYLKKMGVDDPGLRRRLEVSIPYATEDGVGDAFTSIGKDPVVALNSFGKSWQSPSNTVDADAIIILCADANGKLAGMDSIISALQIPTFGVFLPQDHALWESPDLHELATVASKALQRTVPLNRPIVVAGIGFGGLLAHELALNLDSISDKVAAFALFEGINTIANPDTGLSWLSDEVRRDTCQAAAALYPLIVESCGSSAPSLDSIVTRLASIPGFDEQLDYIASFRQENEPEAEWDMKVDLTLSRLGYYKTVAESYSPKDIFPGQTLVFTSKQFSDDVEPNHEDVAHVLGGPNDTWQSIRFLVQPVSIHTIEGKAPTAASIISRYILEAIWRREDAEQRATGMSALPLMSPRPQLASPQVDMEEDYETQSTLCVISPMNRLCPERRYILRHTGRSGTPSQLSSAPLSRIPLWMIHSERGDISRAQKELASMLRIPCYGIALGPDAEECSNIEDLAAAYCSAVAEMQPSGPYLLAGTSVIGSMIAHAMAVQFEASGRQSALILIDGCIGSPSVPLHDTTWYALFYLLREIGNLTTSIGEFVDFVQGAGSPTQQLKFITSFKPSDPGIPVEAWEAAVYATLDRAASIKRMKNATERVTPIFEGPSAIIGPKDRLGKALKAACTDYLQDESGPMDLHIHQRHTECLLSRAGRSEIADNIMKALEYLLNKTG